MSAHFPMDKFKLIAEVQVSPAERIPRDAKEGTLAQPILKKALRKKKG